LPDTALYQDGVRASVTVIGVRERATRLHKVADAIEKRFDCFVQAEVADTGKPVSLASRLDVPRAAANFHVFADLVKMSGLESFQTETPDGTHALNYAVRKPLGVVGVITPWNLPLLLLTWKVAPALACGNAVVVKPSEETPATATLLAEAMQDAGIPSGIYNVVHGFGPGSAGEFLTQHPDVDAVTFTGESRTGAAIMKAVAPTVKPVSFELGGKNAAIVFADSNFEEAVNGFADAVFRAIKAGFLNAVSVGFSPIKYAFSEEDGRTFGVDFLQHAHDFIVHPHDDSRRRACGCEHAVPRARFESRKARFGDGRHLGRRERALRAGYRERP